LIQQERQRIKDQGSREVFVVGGACTGKLYILDFQQILKKIAVIFENDQS
jgi:Ethanolamine utilization protein EutJ (predicted chaperonin)